MNKRLNLKWVSDTIGTEYKKWNKGDVITIQAQTGTGKTYFIKNKLITYMDYNEHMLLIANRINLKRQLKMDLLKNMREEIPKSLEELDKLTTFGNVIIMSYQQINALVNSTEYGQTNFNLDFYDYIVCDEAHFIFSDSGFNNCTDFSFFELIHKQHKDAIKIFISATMEEIKNPIVNNFYKDKFNTIGKSKNQLWDYTTGTDYSYLNTKYFKSIQDLALTIKNDKSDNKWLVFVTKKSDAKFIKETLGDIKSTIITKEVKDNEELDSIIKESKFNSKVLICTKCMDNGINISDESVKNIVLMAWDRVTFLQMLGRIRLDIENPYEINLYVQKKSKKSFTTLLEKSYKHKQDILDKFEGCKDGVLINKNETKEDKEERYKQFCLKYNRDVDKLPKDIFYLDKNGKWKININGTFRLHKDIEFATHMIESFKSIGEFAFILEQLSWINQEEEFSMENLIEDVIDNNDINNREQLLKEFYNEGKIFLTAKDRVPIIEVVGIIDSKNSNIKENKISYVKNINSLNNFLEEINSGYRIYDDFTKTINGKRYKNPWKLVKVKN